MSAKKTSQPDRLLTWGVWCLIVGVLTSWLLGLGVLLIIAAAVCGFIGLFGRRALHSLLLLVVSLVLGVFCAHVAAVVGVFAYNAYLAAPRSEPADVSPGKARG